MACLPLELSKVLLFWDTTQLFFSVIGQLFFVHEQRFYTAPFNLIMDFVANISSVVSEVITDKIGWPYLFQIMDAVLRVQLILCLLFVPESMYIIVGQPFN